MSLKFDLNLTRANKTFNEGDNISGYLVIEAKTDIRHDGIVVLVHGSLNTQPM